MFTDISHIKDWDPYVFTLAFGFDPRLSNKAPDNNTLPNTIFENKVKRERESTGLAIIFLDISFIRFLSMFLGRPYSYIFL